MQKHLLYLAIGTIALATGLTANTAPAASLPQSTEAQSTEAQAAGPQATGLSITTTALHTGRVGQGYSAAIVATGGRPPYTYSASCLPTGLSLDKASGRVTGTPGATAYGTFSVSFTVKDSTKPAALNAKTKLKLVIYQAAAKEVCGTLSLGNNASLNGFVPFDPTDAWNTDISTAPLDPNSAAITSAAGFAGLHLHHDWSSVAGGNYGIPYVVVDSSALASVPINVLDYAAQSDVAVAPYPLTAPIEGAPTNCEGWPDTYIGDAHVLVVDRSTCFLYETFNTHRCKGNWNASSETIWNLTSHEKRPWGWTSADAAGLPIFPGLVRYDEVAAGAIKHAIRFTMQHTKDNANDGYFVEPATHAAGDIWGVSNVMGMRIRLKASFDISGFSKTNQVILTAMKQYGMILADNGGYFFFQGVPDPRWNDNDLVNLDSIQSSNFEVVTMTPAWPGWDATTAPTGAAPGITSFTASASPVSAGTAVQLSWAVSHASYLFIDKVGGVQGTTVTVKPTVTTTYTLNATNQFGRSTKAVTVQVH
jgi:hypothetical protein